MGTMRLTYSNEIRAGTINFFGCDKDDWIHDHRRSDLCETCSRSRTDAKDTGRKGSDHLGGAADVIRRDGSDLCEMCASRVWGCIYCSNSYGRFPGKGSHSLKIYVSFLSYKMGGVMNQSVFYAK